MSNLNIIDLGADNDFESGADGYILKGGQGEVEYNWQHFVPLIEAEHKPRGIYWVPDSRYAPEGQKAAIKSAFPTNWYGALGLWLDIEKPNINMTDADYNKTPYHGYKLVESIWRACNFPGMYFSPGSWDLIMSGAPLALQMEFAEKSPLWMAQYGVIKPDMRGLWPDWAMWQWRGEPDYNHVNQAWWDSLDFTTGGSTMPEYAYSITPDFGDGCSIRGGHDTTFPKIGTLGYRSLAYGNERYTADGEDWLHILTPSDGWIASVHAGKKIATIATIGTVPPVTPPAGVTKTHDIEVFSDGSVKVDGNSIA